MRFASLFFWWKRRPAPRLEHLQFIVHTRRSCHLCDEAWQVLTDEQSRHGFALAAVDVDTDPELAARYGDQVPVVTINGQVRFRGRVNRALLRRLLRAEGKSTSV